MGIGELLLELKSLFKEDEEVLNDGPAEIVMKDVSFGYDEGNPVISDINITISEPGLYCIVGPNGVGKSTLIKCMCKILNISKGEVLINGRSIKEMKHKDVAKYIGYVPSRREMCSRCPFWKPFWSAVRTRMILMNPR